MSDAAWETLSRTPDLVGNPQKLTPKHILQARLGG